MDRASRLWQQVSTAIFTLAGSTIAGGLILLRIEKSVDGWISFFIGFALLGLAVFALRRSLGPSNVRWTFSQAVYYLMSGNEAKDADARAFINDKNIAKDNEKTRALSYALETIWDNCKAGKIRMDGVQVVNGEVNDRAPVEIHPGFFLANKKRFQHPNLVEFSEMTPPLTNVAYVHVVAYRDEIRALPQYTALSKIKVKTLFK